MPVLGNRDIERELLGRKPQREVVPEREGRSRRGRRYRSTSYDSRPSSASGQRRSGSVASTFSVSSRRNGASNQNNLPTLKSLRKQFRNRYGEKTMNVVNRYVEDMETSAEVINNINYLRRCRDLRLIPREYWMINLSIRNTKEVVRLLDDCSYRLMCHDQQYYLLRRIQLTKKLSRTEEQLEKLLNPQDQQRLFNVVTLHRSQYFERIREDQRKSVELLRKEVEDYQSYIRRKRKPRRNTESSDRSMKDRQSKTTKNDRSQGDRGEQRKGSKDSDGEDGERSHRVQRRTAGSVSSHDEESASDAGDD